MPKPNFFIVGAPKCGTSSLGYYLSQHPDIFMAPKELQFFGSDLKTVDNFRRPPDKAKTSLEVYLNHFKDAQRESRIGDNSVFYLYSKKAAEEIHAFDPNSKIIIMLRHPIDMLESLHSQLIYDAVESETDFLKALELEKDRKVGRAIPKTAVFPQILFYREVALYSRQVKRYLDIFEKDQVLVILFDELKSSTESVYRKTLGFLEIDASYQADLSPKNPNTVSKFPKIKRLLVNPPQWLQPVAKPLANNIGIRNLIRDLDLKLNTAHKKRASVTNLQKANLYHEFSQDIQHLEEILKRDLSTWKHQY